MTEHATMRDKAIALAQQGFRVFPVRQGTKSPAVPHGRPRPAKGTYHQFIPSRDPDDVLQMWSTVSGRPLAYDIGINTEGLLVLDVDDKDNRTGSASFQQLASEHGLSVETVTASTPSGGRHYFYRLPVGVDPTTVMFGSDKLGSGIDHRSYNSLVVAAGAKRPNGEYAWVRSPDDSPMAEAPRSLVELCVRARERKPEDPLVVPGFEVDQPDAIERFRQYALREGPEAVQSAGGRSGTIALLRRAGDYGLTAMVAVETLCEPGGWNWLKAHPPWDEGELLELAESLEPSRDRPIGCDSPSSQFDCVEIEARTEATESDKPRAKRLFWEGFHASRNKMAQEGTAWLVKKYLGHNEMSVVYGESGAGKTFVVLDLAYHIAMGQDWNGQSVKGGLVVYVAAEAGTGIRSRLEALHRRYKPSKEPALVIVPCLVDLFSPNADLKPLLALLDEISNAYGLPIEMVVLDTLARVIGPGDENSARDMGVLVQAMDRVRVEAKGAHVMTVHHSGKNTAKGARGSSALRAATDTELEIEGGRIIVRKQRNGEAVKPVGFRLASVELGKDADGDSVTSCTVELGAAVDFGPQLTAEQQEWVDQLEAYADLCDVKTFTYQDMQRVWSQPERDLAAVEGNRRYLPIRTVRERAAALKISGGLEVVSKKDIRPVVYRLAAVEEN